MRALEREKAETVGAVGILVAGALSIVLVLGNRVGVEEVNVSVARDDKGLSLRLEGAMDTILEDLRFPNGNNETEVVATVFNSGAGDSRYGLTGAEPGGLVPNVSSAGRGSEGYFDYRVAAKMESSDQDDIESRGTYLSPDVAVFRAVWALPHALIEGVRLKVVHVESGGGTELDEVLLKQGLLALLRQPRIVQAGAARLVIAGPEEAARSVGARRVVELVTAFMAETSVDRGHTFILDAAAQGSHVVLGAGCAVLRPIGERKWERAALVATLWRAVQDEEPLEHAHDPEGLLRDHAWSYLGYKDGLDEDGAQARDLRAASIEAMYTAQADAQVRPSLIPLNERANWNLILPGLLALADRSCAAVGQELCGELRTGRADSSILDTLRGAIAHDEGMKALLEQGKVYGIESELQPGKDLDWMLGARESPSLPLTNLPSIAAWVGAHQEEYIETCGCKARQTGGLARRARLLRERDADLRIDLGGLVIGRPSPDAQESKKRREFLEGAGMLGIDAICVGPNEIVAGLEELLSMPEFLRLPTTSCNLVDASGALLFQPFRSVTREGVRYAIVGWTSPEAPLRRQARWEVGLGSLRVDRSPERLIEAIAAARSTGAQVLVAGEVSPRIIAEHEEALSGADILLTSWTKRPSRESFRLPASISHRSKSSWYMQRDLLVLPVVTGPGVLAHVETSETEVETRLYPLDDTVEKAADVDAYVAGLNKEAELEFNRVLQRLDGGQEYVGATSCRSCHEAHYEDWKMTRHSAAMNTLFKVRRNDHPRCVKCHVTGYGVEQGFSDRENRPLLFDVQCEACHGPGREHVQAPTASNIERTPKLESCHECHDAEHSDMFSGRVEEAMDSVSHRSFSRPEGNPR